MKEADRGEKARAVSWSAAQYTKFEDERTRPVRDLLSVVSPAAPRRVVDVGCGPGNSTEMLAARFPEAKVLAIDSAPDMCAAARARLPHVRVVQCALEAWLAGEIDATDPGPWDVILSNAVLQWVPEHAALLPAMVARLSPGGTLAVQVPDNLSDPSHVAMEQVAREPAFAPWLTGVSNARATIGTAEDYHALLRPLCARVETWRTTYYHELPAGIDGIVEWMKGTGLRPFLDPLPAEARTGFVDRYRTRLMPLYPVQENGSVLFPFPRLFLVATRGR